MLHAAFLMPLFPLAGFVVLAAVGRRMGNPLAGWVGTVAMAGAFVAACVTFAGLLRVGPTGSAPARSPRPTSPGSRSAASR